LRSAILRFHCSLFLRGHFGSGRGFFIRHSSPMALWRCPLVCDLVLQEGSWPPKSRLQDSDPAVFTSSGVFSRVRISFGPCVIGLRPSACRPLCLRLPHLRCRCLNYFVVATGPPLPCPSKHSTFSFSLTLCLPGPSRILVVVF